VENPEKPRPQGVKISLDNDSGIPYCVDVIGKVPKNAPKFGPTINIRFRNEKEVKLMKRAAKEQGLSFNTFVVESAFRSAEGILAANRGNPEPDLQATA
jgi:hypothetical protein